MRDGQIAIASPVKARALPASSSGIHWKTKSCGKAIARTSFENIVSGGLRKTKKATVEAGR